ncbi:hypothetical protein ASG25_20670 [Rhizobium sp. Leaf384]|uniref:DNA cytosine methyltransferase n=1 Tax=Rhizobium sp. Leaf384 TaxID=1736358 RepID=UPI0007154C62|nr:DNA (cytosine-5-)-methyltransferase [Rhizobium sp. Leaf384]KQS75176.1 hypothetical protein ASG25_20670 [Rhizobium sp. Leaf384]
MRAIELFCGAGGLSIGLKQAGIEVVHAVDAWIAAVKIYSENVGAASIADLNDIKKIAPFLFDLRPDLIAGGPPCQDYSSAGKRLEGERADLTTAYGMLISIVRPKWLLMENVPGVLNSRAWRYASAMLRHAGYGLTIQKLDAARYGVGQTRERLIVVGCLDEANGFLTDSLMAAALPRLTCARDILGPTVGDTFYVHPRHMYKRRVWPSGDPAPTVRSTYARRMPPDYELIASDAHSESSPTELTRDQVSALQGFPACFDWSAVRVSDRDRMVANAVPVPLARAIGTVIMDRERGVSQPVLERQYTEWLLARGMAQSTIDDMRTKTNRARRMLGGRIFADTAVEIAALEGMTSFKELPVKTQSALRVSLRTHARFREECLEKNGAPGGGIKSPTEPVRGLSRRPRG